MDSEEMPKFDPKRDAAKLKPYDLILMKRAEAEQLQKVTKYKQIRKTCNIAGISLAAIAIGIYGFTIYSWKQETFLDDFNEPEKIIEDKPIQQ